MDRNSAPCPILATPISSSRERSSGVATTASVVFPRENGSRTYPSRNASSVPARPFPSPVRAPASHSPERGSNTSPKAFTTAHAPPSASPAPSLAVPNPPFIARPAPRPPGSPLRSRSGRLLRGDIGHLRGWPERRIPEAQIVDDRRGNDRDHPRGGGEPDASFLEEAHHSRRGVEPERAPPRQDESVDTARRMGAKERIHLPRAGGLPPDVGGPHRAQGEEKDGDPGPAPKVVLVPQQNPGHVGVRSPHPPSSTQTKLPE